MKKLRIGLLWHSLRAGNLGVGALTLGNMAIIQDVADGMGVDIQFVVLSMREASTKPIADGAEQYEIDTKRLLSPSGFARQVENLDVVVDIGAGDSFADIYGWKRFMFLWLTKRITIAKNRPLILAPQTIGPFTSQPYRALAASVMDKSEAVVARDEQSLAAIGELSPKANSSLAVDVAFKLPFEQQGSDTAEGRSIKVGINASGLLCQQAESGQNRFGLSFDYLQLQRDLLRYFTERGDCEVHLVTHATSFKDKGDDDGIWADRLAHEFPEAIRVPNFDGPSEAKSYISGLDFVIAGRMHACIAAYSSKTPVVPISYSRKFSGLFTLLSYPYYTPMQGVTQEGIFQTVRTSFENDRAAMVVAEEKALERVDELLEPYRDVLRHTFATAREGSR